VRLTLSQSGKESWEENFAFVQRDSYLTEGQPEIQVAQPKKFEFQSCSNELFSELYFILLTKKLK